jgi:uncharacterized protein
MSLFTISNSEPFPSILVNDLKLILLPEKAIFCPNHHTIFIADPHFGKASHFRKAGIPVPETLHWEDFEIIKHFINLYQLREIYFLGDLFHSQLNDSWEFLEIFTHQFPNIIFHLIKGNHDRYLPITSPSKNFIFHHEPLIWKGLWLSHEPAETSSFEMLNLCGHLHPGWSMTTATRQKLRLPCFYLHKNQLILPAFGRFTGLYIPEKNKGDVAFVIADNKVIPFNLSK